MKSILVLLVIAAFVFGIDQLPNVEGVRVPPIIKILKKTDGSEEWTLKDNSTICLKKDGPLTKILWDANLVGYVIHDSHYLGVPLDRPPFKCENRDVCIAHLIFIKKMINSKNRDY